MNTRTTEAFSITCVGLDVHREIYRTRRRALGFSPGDISRPTALQNATRMARLACILILSAERKPSSPDIGTAGCAGIVCASRKHVSIREENAHWYASGIPWIHPWGACQNEGGTTAAANASCKSRHSFSALRWSTASFIGRCDLRKQICPRSSSFIFLLG